MKLPSHSVFVILPLLLALLPNGGFAQSKVDQTRSGQRKEKMPQFRIFNPDTISKPNGYSHVAEVNEGKIVYIAGQVALDGAGNLVGKDDFRAQVQQVFENLKAAVEAAGGDFKSVIKLNYYCAESVDAAQLPVLREVRDKYVNTATRLSARWCS